MDKRRRSRFVHDINLSEKGEFEHVPENAEHSAIGRFNFRHWAGS